MSSPSANPSSHPPPPRRASSSGGSQLNPNAPRRLQLATGASIQPPPSRGSSFAAIAALAQAGGTPSSSAGPSAVVTPAGIRRQSVPSSPSPRIHRATSGTTSAWGSVGHSLGNVVTPSTPSPSSFPGGPLAAANADMTLGMPSVPAPPTAFFSRPPYLEHTAFKHLFKQDIFQNIQTPGSSSLNGSSTISSSLSPAKPVSGASSGAPLPRRPAYSPAYLLGGALSPESTSSSAVNSDVEDSDSAVPRTARPRDAQARKKLVVRPEEEVFTLPTRWNDSDRHASIHISISGSELTFMGGQGNLNGVDNKDEAAAARTNNFIPPICGVYYYEVEVLDRGTASPPITPLTELYPCIGLRSSRERVLTNFGQYPFRFDIEAYVIQARSKAWKDTIQAGTTLQWQIDQKGMKILQYPDTAPVPAATSTGGAYGVPHITIPPRPGTEASAGFTLPPISTSGFTISPHELTAATPSASADTSPPVVGREVGGDNPQVVVRELVLEYLIQSGYPATARAFKSQCDQQRVDEEAAEAAVVTADDNRLGLGWQAKKVASSNKANAPDQSGDTKMTDGESKDDLPPGVKSRPIGPGMNVEDSMIRRQIIDAVRRGDIDSALQDLEVHYPVVVRDGDTPDKRAGGSDPNGENAGIRFKLSCRKLVEMILEAAASTKKRSTAHSLPLPSDGMDIDGESSLRAGPPLSTPYATSSSNLTWKQQQKQRAHAPPSDDITSYDIEGLNRALEYGTILTNHYGSDKRVKVQALMKMSSGLVAYDDPLNAANPVSKFAGEEARNELAEEVNSAILGMWTAGFSNPDVVAEARLLCRFVLAESQGRQRDSALERLYRQAGGVVRQLGVMGEGLAAFVDMDREFCGR
ncbi:hypothetical protein FRC00_010468 [Tulasnella sp. 408]|nr:hypothetical protein FRC00_010468 [Tulasnella sp. 408]